ncbi:MAG: type II toxin-antitoxin system VapC family toxin [Rhizomicrobium sp.]
MKQPLLLDTCACLWLMGGELTDKAEKALADSYSSGLPLYVSPVTALEIGTSARKGRFKSVLTPQRWFAALVGQPGMVVAAMPPELLIESALLPGNIHNDPYDRIIAATAREYGYAVLTSDRALLAYGAEGHLAVVAC